MKRLVLCVIAFGWTLNQQSGPEIRTDLFKRSIISKCGYICCSSLYILFNEKITFSAMLFTRILLGLELDHLLAHLAVLEQQHLPDCQERSLGRKSWRKLVLVATKRRREAIKRNFSQPASLTSYSGENFGAEILLTAAGQNWAKWQSKGLVLIDKKWKRCDTNGPNLERYLEHEVWIEVQKLLFQGLPTSYFSTVKGTDQWPRNIRHGIWNILWKTQPYNFYKQVKMLS